MTMRIVAILLCLWAVPALAVESRGGPVHTVLTVAQEKLDVDVTWLQTGGVVLLKIVSREPVPAEKRNALLPAARELLGGKAGAKVHDLADRQAGRQLPSDRLEEAVLRRRPEDLTLVHRQQQGLTGIYREFSQKNSSPQQYQWVGIPSREFSSSEAGNSSTEVFWHDGR